MIDDFDASHGRLRLAVDRGIAAYDEDELFACVVDQEPIIRTAAARRLHVRGTRSSFERAMKLIAHPRFDMREMGAFLLGQLGTPDCPFAQQSFPALARLLSDPYGEVQAAAAGAIGSLGCLGHVAPADVRERLVQLLDSERMNVELGLDEPCSSLIRARIAFALGTSDDPVAKAQIASLANDIDSGVRDTAGLAAEMQTERSRSRKPGRRSERRSTASVG